MLGQPTCDSIVGHLDIIKNQEKLKVVPTTHMTFYDICSNRCNRYSPILIGFFIFGYFGVDGFEYVHPFDYIYLH